VVASYEQFYVHPPPRDIETRQGHCSCPEWRHGDVGSDCRLE